MKFIANRKAMIAAIKQATIVANEEHNSLLSQVVIISAAKTKLKIVSASSVVWIKTHLSGKENYQMVEAGECGISYKFLLKVLSASISESIDFVLTADEKLEIIDEDGKTALSVIGIEDFPAEPKTPKSELISFPSADLTQALRCVSVASQNTKSDYNSVLSGVLIDTNEDGDYVFVATDSYRLAVCPIPAALENKKLLSGKVIPAELAKIILSFSSSDVIQIAMTDNHCYVISGDTVVRSVWETGDFPKYKDILKKIEGDIENETVINVSDVANFAAVLNRVTAVSMSSDSSVSVSSKNQDSSLSMKLSSDYGDTKYYVGCDYEHIGTEDTVAFNQTFLKDVLTHAATNNELAIVWSTDRSPVQFIDTAMDGHFHILMPKIN